MYQSLLFDTLVLSTCSDLGFMVVQEYFSYFDLMYL